jgi:proteic killer suppression protein
MKIEFADEDLKRLYQDPAFRVPAIGPDLTKAYRKVVGFIDKAEDERDLREMKSLHLEKLKGQREGQHSLALNDQWRLIVRIERGEDGKTVVLIEIVDYH